MTPQRKIGLITAVAGFVFIGVMTLTPEPGAPPSPPSLCIVCGGLGLQDIILNVLLFVPFAFGMRLAGVRRWRAFAAAAAFSLTIELLQLRVVVGRDASLGDFLTNSTGALVGIALAERWRGWLVPAARGARHLMWGWLGVLALVLGATSWGERVSLPRTLYWGQWAPELLYMDRFPGRLLGASVNAVPFPQGAMGNSAAFRSLLTSDSVVVSATVVSGGGTARVAPIASVFDWRRTEIFLLGQRGVDLVFSIRMNAARALVRNPAVRLAGAFAGARGAVVRVEGGIVRHALVVRATRAGRVLGWSAPLTPGLGWCFFLPFDYALGTGLPFLSALWMAGLLAPLGYWWGRARVARGEGAAMLAGVVVVMAALGPLFGERGAAWWEWVGAGVGMTIGWWLGGRGRAGHAAPVAGETGVGVLTAP